MREPPKRLVEAAIKANCDYRGADGLPIRIQERFNQRMRKAWAKVASAMGAEGSEELSVYERLGELSLRRPASRLVPGKDY